MNNLIKDYLIREKGIENPTVTTEFDKNINPIVKGIFRGPDHPYVMVYYYENGKGDLKNISINIMDLLEFVYNSANKIHYNDKS